MKKPDIDLLKASSWKQLWNSELFTPRQVVFILIIATPFILSWFSIKDELTTLRQIAKDYPQTIETINKIYEEVQDNTTLTDRNTSAVDHIDRFLDSEDPRYVRIPSQPRLPSHTPSIVQPFAGAAVP